jgi:hypothetical protein
MHRFSFKANFIQKFIQNFDRLQLIYAYNVHSIILEPYSCLFKNILIHGSIQDLSFKGKCFVNKTIWKILDSILQHMIKIPCVNF